MNNYRYEDESGRSMIEMLGVLAIIGVLSVGGIAGYSKAMNKFKTNQVADNVSMLVANIKTLYAQQNSYTGLNNVTAVDMGVVPDELTGARTEASGTKTQNLENAFNGSVLIQASNSKGVSSASSEGDALAFTLIFNGLSKEACITLATNDWGSSYSSGLIGMQVAAETQSIADDAQVKMGCETGGGTKGKFACPGHNIPMNVMDAATACACGSGNTCSIMWKYY